MASNDTIADAQGALQSGLGGVTTKLQDLLADPPVDTAMAMALDGLRSRYTLYQMQLNRAAILSIDNSKPMIDALQKLSQVTAKVRAAQSAATASTAWINDTAAKLDELMDAVGIVKAISAGAGKASTAKGG